MNTERLFKSIEKIEIQNVSKKYDDHFAVKNLNLDIIGGELLILIGGSGSGKTTTLKMINRLISPDEGDIIINGINTKDFNLVTLRRNIGYVIQEIGLFPHLTVGDNIGLIPKLEKWDNDKINKRILELLKLVDLNSEMFKDRYPRELSGGQQQRVGLARSLALDPRLLLMDEPFGALDPILRRQLHDEFLHIKKDIGRTIIFVTHDIDEAFKLGDRIGIMHEGVLLQVDTPEELILNPKNEIVANLVDADRKFRHLDTLVVKELMTTFDKKYVFHNDMKSDDALKKMMKNNIELGIIQKDDDFIGWVTMKNLLKSNKQDFIEKIISSPISFNPNDNLTSALNEMKKKKQPIAIVLENNKPIGLLFADRVLFNLV
ncbi:ATP-binding cassette domain-containing protein [Thermoplasmatota archaeon]